MNSWTRHPPWAAGAAIAALLGTLLTTACSKKIVDVDPAAFPEGVASPSQLVMYRDAPNFVYVYHDTLPIGPSSRDQLVDIVNHYRKASGVALGVIFDFTPADDYEIHRREAGGGYARLKDFLLQPTRLWLDSQSEIYQFDDPTVGPMDRDYVARGLIEKVANATSPLTNIAEVNNNGLVGNEITILTDTLRIRRDVADTTRGNIRRIEWTTAFGAAGYWLHVYQATEQNNFGLFARGFPSPVFTGRARDYLVAYVPDNGGPTITFDTLSVIAGARVLMNRPIVYQQVYEVHVAAVDAEGRLISVIQVDPTTLPFAAAQGLSGAIRGDALTQLVGQEYSEEFYGIYPIGSYSLASENPPLPGTSANAEAGPDGLAARTWSSRRH